MASRRARLRKCRRKRKRDCAMEEDTKKEEVDRKRMNIEHLLLAGSLSRRRLTTSVEQPVTYQPIRSTECCLFGGKNKVYPRLTLKVTTGMIQAGDQV